MKRIYLSGPMTGLPERNFPAFVAEAARLRALGYEVVNPTEINGNAHVLGLSHIECLRNDAAGLATCDTLAMLRLPDGHYSKGMQIEIDIADLLEIRMVHARMIMKPCVDSELPTPSAIRELVLSIGNKMVEITTTVRSHDEWPAIPGLWLDTMHERNRHWARINFLTTPGKPRRVEEHKGLFRVYEDESRSYDDHAKWRAMTNLYYASALQAIDEAMKARMSELSAEFVEGRKPS